MEEEIKKIETILKKYDSIAIVKYLAFMLTRLTERNTHPFFKNLKSPYKQLHYVASIALKIDSEGDKTFSSDDWNEISICLHKIENLYNDAGSIKLSNQNKELLKKKGVSQAAFLNYFFNGSLSFQEQYIDRIETTFLKYDKEIKNETGISVNDFIRLAELAIKECNLKFNLPLKIKESSSWSDFTSKMDDLDISIDEWHLYMPKEFNEAFEILREPESCLVIDLENLNVEVELEDLRHFLEFLSVSKDSKRGTTYYGEKLPLELNPFVKLSDTEFLLFYQNELFNAIYEKLVPICSQRIGPKFYRHRDIQVENKTLEIFKLLFNEKKAKIFSSYSVDGHSEQDILVIHKQTAFIIEVKAASFREPMRDPLKAFSKIKSDFKKNIQEAYNQCLRVEDAFDFNESVDIFDKKGKIIETINSEYIRNTFSIIVTLDRFGLIQSDLHHLLEIDDDLPFPWSVNIDDLEVFLLLLKKKKKVQKKLETFLINRELLHGRLHATDEMDVCCWYLRDPLDFIKECKNSHSYIIASPVESNMADRIYFSSGGLGFKNERNMDLKNNENTLFMGKPE